MLSECHIDIILLFQSAPLETINNSKVFCGFLFVFFFLLNYLIFSQY